MQGTKETDGLQTFLLVVVIGWTMTAPPLIPFNPVPTIPSPTIPTTPDPAAPDPAAPSPAAPSPAAPSPAAPTPTPTPEVPPGDKPLPLLGVPPNLDALFANLQSPGVNAIGAAEGNRYPDGRNTPLYYKGHSDPGNGVFNRGWCSDQGRGRNNAEADRLCLDRTRSRMRKITTLFRREGIDPSQPQHILAWVNCIDLWNQASPRVSDACPSKYAEALKQGKAGADAILWMRVESFRRNGRIDAAGLLRICARSRDRSHLSAWDCVASDQRRRQRQIEKALQIARVVKHKGAWYDGWMP